MSTPAKFTPGPWYAESPHLTRVRTLADGCDGAIIADAHHTEGEDTHAGIAATIAEQRANACLIASAPVLYAVLEAVALNDQGGTAQQKAFCWDVACAKAHSALAQARGES